MRAILRRVSTIASIGVAVLIALPATVLGDCTGPVCGEVNQEGLDALGVVALAAVLIVFVTVMAVGGRIVGKDRGSWD